MDHGNVQLACVHVCVRVFVERGDKCIKGV